MTSMAMKGLLLLQRRGDSTNRRMNINMKNKVNFFSARSLSGNVNNSELRVFIVAGEASGDVIGGRLMASLKQLSPVNLRFAGVGGALMIREGLQSRFPMDDLTVMGVWELIPHMYSIMAQLQETIEVALDFQPHVVVTIDSKGFAFCLLKCLRGRYAQQGITPPFCVHYVAPSFWAWKGGVKRLKGLTSIVDHLLCILPFEEEVCRMNGLATTFVGHPILEDVFNDYADKNLKTSKWHIEGDGAKFRMEHGLSSGTTIMTLLPGSRLQEVNRMLPIFGCTLELLKDTFHDLTAVIPVAPNQQVAAAINEIVERWSFPVVLVDGESVKAKYDAFAASVAGLSTSGTAVLQLQLARLPCVVAYRCNLLTEWSALLLAKSHYISLPNILLNSEVLPESIFSACTPKQLASRIRHLIQNEHLQEQQAAAARKVFDILSPPIKPLDGPTIEGFETSHLLQNMKSPMPSMLAAYTILSSLKWQG